MPASDATATSAAASATSPRVVGGIDPDCTAAASKAITAPRVTPPATAPRTNQEAVAPYRWPLPRSATGVMVESIDRPHGDQVERAAAPTATNPAATAIQNVMGLPSLGG